jgi:DnaJ-class molecular chaperone
MALNYYEKLELTKNANQEEIAHAYRRLSLKYHPKRNINKDFAVNNFYFHQIAEAYEVLSDPNKKSVYDVYGEDGLKKGVKDSNIWYQKGGYSFGGDAYKIYEKFFGSNNPFLTIKDGIFLK